MGYTYHVTDLITSYYAVRCAKLAEDPSIRPHGDLGTYNNWGCRCDECTEARRLYDTSRERPTAAQVFTAVTDDKAPHGTFARYGAGCKCDVCLAFVKAQFGAEDPLADVI